MNEANAVLDNKILDNYDTLQFNTKSLIDKSVSMYQMVINLSYYDFKRANFLMSYYYEIKDKAEKIKQELQSADIEIHKFNQSLHQSNKSESFDWENINTKKKNIAKNLEVVDKYLMWTYSNLLENNIVGHINNIKNRIKSLNFSLVGSTSYISE